MESAVHTKTARRDEFDDAPGIASTTASELRTLLVAGLTAMTFTAFSWAIEPEKEVMIE
jgi:hypothetical protein